MAARVGEYLLFETLGHGAFGEVKAGVHASTGTSVAVKVMSKDTIKAQDMSLNVRREIAILKTLKHRNIVGLHGVLSSKRNVYVVLDMVDGGELFDRIANSNAKGLPEHEARHYFRQLVTGVLFCHARGVVHRDLKPENLLIDNHTGDLRIADFGLSAIKGAGNTAELLHTRAGTPNYLPPEAISNIGEGYNGEKLDAWACGIILYALLAGYLPFDDKDIKRLFRAIRIGSVEYPPWFSDSAKSLLSNLLNVDWRKRYSVHDAKYHPWCQADSNGTPSHEFSHDMKQAYAQPETRRERQSRDVHRRAEVVTAGHSDSSQRSRASPGLGTIDRAASTVHDSRHKIAERAPSWSTRSNSLLRAQSNSLIQPNPFSEERKRVVSPNSSVEPPRSWNQWDTSVLDALRHLQSVIAISWRDSKTELTAGQNLEQRRYRTFERIVSGVNSMSFHRSKNYSMATLTDSRAHARFAEEQDKTLRAIRKIRGYVISIQERSDPGIGIPTDPYDRRRQRPQQHFDGKESIALKLLDVWELRVLNETAMEEENASTKCSVSEEELLALQNILGQLDDTIVGNDDIACDIHTDTAEADRATSDAQKFSFLEKRGRNADFHGRGPRGAPDLVMGLVPQQTIAERGVTPESLAGISGGLTGAKGTEVLTEAQQLQIPSDHSAESRVSHVFAFAQDSAEQVDAHHDDRGAERTERKGTFSPPAMVSPAWAKSPGKLCTTHQSPKSANAIVREAVAQKGTLCPKGLASAQASINAAVDNGALPLGAEASMRHQGGSSPPEKLESFSGASRDRLRVSIRSPPIRNGPATPSSPDEDYGPISTVSWDTMSSTLRRKSTSSKSTPRGQESKRKTREHYRNARKSFGHWAPGAQKKCKSRDPTSPEEPRTYPDQRAEKHGAVKELNGQVQSKARPRWFGNSRATKTERNAILAQFGSTTPVRSCLLNLKRIADSLGCEVIPKARSSTGWERLLLRVPSGRYIPPLAIGVVVREYTDSRLGINSAIIFSMDDDATPSARTGMARFLEDLKEKSKTVVSGFSLIDL